jgi:hypothetical protein
LIKGDSNLAKDCGSPIPILRRTVVSVKTCLVKENNLGKDLEERRVECGGSAPVELG